MSAFAHKTSNRVQQEMCQTVVNSLRSAGTDVRLAYRVLDEYLGDQSAIVGHISQQWDLAQKMTSAVTLSAYPIDDIESTINAVSVTHGMGGSHVWQRAFSIGLVGRLCAHLSTDGVHTLAQLNIITKNIVRLLDEHPSPEHDVCRLQCVWAMCTIVLHWTPHFAKLSHATTLNLPFVSAAVDSLLEYLVERPAATSDSQLWIRWAMVDALSRFHRSRDIWKCFSKDMVQRFLRACLTCLEDSNMDEVTLALLLSNIIAHERFLLTARALPNYLAQLLAAVLSHLPPLHAQGECLRDLRLSALAVVAAFVAGEDCRGIWGDRPLPKWWERWATACCSEREVVDLHNLVTAAYKEFIRVNGISPTSLVHQTVPLPPLHLPPLHRAVTRLHTSVPTV